MQEQLQGQINEQVKAILLKIDYLEKFINLIQQNVNHNFEFFIACLTLIAGVTAAAIVFLVKITVNKKVDEQLISIKEQIKSELKQELKKELEAFIKENQQLRMASGTCEVQQNNEVYVSGLSLSEISARYLPYKFEVSTYNNYKKLEYDYELFSGGFRLKLKNYNRSTDGNIKWTLVWLNDKLYN